ncbi:MAG: Ig-like domain-containing protein [Bacteroidales bacterium]
MKKNYLILTITIAAFIMPLKSIGQRQMENLSRGLIAIRTGSSQVFVNWRMLGTEYNSGATFNLYNGSTRIASNLSTTNYVHTTSSNETYTVRAVINGSEQSASAAAGVRTSNYLDVALQIPSGGTTPSGESYTYSANDCSVGDLDGDGEYEIVVKWDPSNSKDNSLSGYTGNQILDAYKLNGTRMWRIDLGINIRSGAHYTQFMVYDLDGDGKAEVACKTAPGTRSGTGSYLGNGPAASDNDAADYRNSNGYILTGPEYLTIFNGQTGAERVTINYEPARGKVGDWGDTYGNRVDRFLACIAYLDGSRPSLVMCRGYYTRAVLVAYDFRNGSLTKRWTFDSNSSGNGGYAGQGNHNLSVADVDADGKDEIIYGSCAIDDNGRGLWTTGLGHGDALHVSDINTSRPGLEVWGIHEGSGTPGAALLDARTGQILWKTANADVGRGVAADLTGSYAGMECWGGTSGLRTSTNGSAGSNPASTNHLIWWDGDEIRELLNGTSITKYGGSTLLSASGCASNNATKSNPALTADIFGDWREEAIWRTTDSRYLRIYSATTTTSRRMYTMMHDPQYRLSIAWQNVAYNQPPHTGFFFGSGMPNPPNPNITLVGGTAIIPVTGVTVSPTSASVNTGATTQLTATVAPSNATNKNVSWGSDNTSVATVSSTGLVSGVAAGSATITVTTQDGSITATCAVTVNASTDPLAGYTFAANEKQTFTYTGTVDIAYGASDKYFYLYNQSGGSCACTNATFGGDPIYGTAKKCYTKPVGGIAVTGVILPPTLEICGGATIQLTATVSPSNATNKTVSWSSNNISVATVNSTGLVTGVATGSATIKVTTQDGGYTATCMVTVIDCFIPVTSVTVSPTVVSLNTGATAQLTATVSPSNATNKTVSWSSNNISVATVNSTGLVTGIAPGSAIITVTTQDGGKTATCAITPNPFTTVTIQENATGFCSVDGTIDNNNAGFTGTGFANTDNASGKGITWSVNVPSAGTYSLVWRFANGGTTDRPGQLMVDGATVISGISFPSTGAWTTWTETSGTNVTLSAGIRLIRLQATSSGGLSNTDYLSITGNNPQPFSCTGQKSTMSSSFADNSIEFQIFPNPVTVNRLNVRIITGNTSSVNIIIYNIAGEIIETDRLGKFDAGEINHSMAVENLIPGMYVIRIQSDFGYKTSSFIRQ